MTDSWKTNKKTKRDDSGDRVSRFFVLERDHIIIMKKFAFLKFPDFAKLHPKVNRP